MISIGLTGNICSGYERVAKMFSEMHQIPVFDADIAVKFLLNYREDIIKDIRIRFGIVVYNRGLIEASHFNTTEKFDKLLDIIEPELLNTFDKWKSRQNSTYVIFKSSILLERGLNKKMNYTITSFIPRDERALELSKVTTSGLVESYSIINSEMDELIKNQNSDWIIHNYDNLSLLAQTQYIHDKIESSSTLKHDLSKIIRNIMN